MSVREVFEVAIATFFWMMCFDILVFDYHYRRKVLTFASVSPDARTKRMQFLVYWGAHFFGVMIIFGLLSLVGIIGVVGGVFLAKIFWEQLADSAEKKALKERGDAFAHNFLR